MTAGAISTYDKWPLFNSNGTIQSGHTFKAALFQTSSNAATLTHDRLSDLTNELAAANGYTAGGITLANFTVTESAGVTIYDCDDFDFIPSGGDLTALYCVIYRSGTVNSITDALVCVFQLDTSGEVTRTPPDKFQIVLSATGLSTIQRAT